MSEAKQVGAIDTSSDESSGSQEKDAENEGAADSLDHTVSAAQRFIAQHISEANPEDRSSGSENDENEDSEPLDSYYSSRQRWTISQEERSGTFSYDSLTPSD